MFIYFKKKFIANNAKLAAISNSNYQEIIKFFEAETFSMSMLKQLITGIANYRCANSLLAPNSEVKNNLKRRFFATQRWETSLRVSPITATVLSSSRISC